MLLLVIAVLAYGAAYYISEWLSVIIGIPYVVTAPVILVFLCIVLFVLKRNGLLGKYGVRLPNNICCSFLISIPLAVIPFMNIYMKNCVQAAIEFSIDKVPYIIFLGLSAFSEELLFRGVLPSALSERFRFNVYHRTATVNVLFALMHMGNALGGASLEPTIIQSVLALSIGTCFSGITEKSESVFPAACMHWLINLSSLHESFYTSTLPLQELWIWLDISIMCIIYGIILIGDNKEAP